MVAKSNTGNKQETKTGNTNSMTSQMRIDRNRQGTTTKNQNKNNRQEQGTFRKETTRRKNDGSRHT